MIIKKPYGFLIKHFKLIHMLLLVPTIYLLLKFGDISSFFRTYISQNFQTHEVTVAGSYITLLTYLALIAMILINGVIFLLMRSKKKPTIVYASGMIYYIILLIVSLVFYSTMSSIDTSTLDPTIVNFVSDIASFVPLPGYILAVAYAIKGLGFNIKTMRFDNNLDLHASDEDDEEIELKINSDGYVAKRTIIHTLRELKYYILENKFVFTCFGVVLVVALIIIGYLNFEVYNKKYKLYQAFVLDNFTMSLKESYLTNVDYSGNIINKDSYFVAVKIAIQNKSYQDLSIDSSNFRLYIGKDVVYPSYDRSSRFIDIGKNYQGNTIMSQTANDYVFVYELKKDQLKTQYQIKILSDLKKKPGELTPSYKIINIRPKNILKSEIIGTGQIGKEIILKDTLLGNTVYKLKSVKFQNAYQYEAEQCIGVGNCKKGNHVVVATGGKSLMIIEDEIKWDETTSYYKNSKKDFYGDFAKISYRYKSLIYDKDYTSTLKDVTPSILKGVKVYEVSNMLEVSTNRKLEFKIRNKTYTIELEKQEK